MWKIGGGRAITTRLRTIFFSYGNEDPPQKNRSTTIQERFQLEEALDLIPQKEAVPRER